MIQMFLGILDHGIGDVNQLAGGIGKALVCTAAGMIVAIPALMAHRWFRGRIAEYIVDMEHEAIQLIDTIDRVRRRRSRTGRPRQHAAGEHSECGLSHAHPRPPRDRRAGDQPGSADRRDPGADHLLRRHRDLRCALGAQAGAAASAQVKPANDSARALIVLVNADGRYFVDDREVLRDDVESLKGTLAEVAGNDRERPVLLRADARTPYQAVVTAYDALGQLGFRRS